jgi:serine/threonine-protein kinase RsbW
MLDRSFAFMGSARDHSGSGTVPDGHRVHLIFPGDEASVRTALATAMSAFDRMALTAHLRLTVEIVLAEVLNNVVEHAYSDHGRGVIEIAARRQQDALTFRISDDGRPMPAGKIPEGRPHDLDVPPDQLPEGGFGWLLIRELTHGLEYRRSANRNELRFRIALSEPPRLN